MAHTRESAPNSAAETTPTPIPTTTASRAASRPSTWIDGRMRKPCLAHFLVQGSDG